MLLAANATTHHYLETCQQHRDHFDKLFALEPAIVYLSKIGDTNSMTIQDQDAVDELAQIILQILYSDRMDFSRPHPMFAYRQRLFAITAAEFAQANQTNHLRGLIDACKNMCITDISVQSTPEYLENCQDVAKLCQKLECYLPPSSCFTNDSAQNAAPSKLISALNQVVPYIARFYSGFFLAALPDGTAYSAYRLTGSRRIARNSALLVNLAMLAALFSADKDLIFTSVYFVSRPLLNSTSEQARNYGNLAVFLTPIVMAAPLPSQFSTEGIYSFAPMLFTLIQSGLSMFGSSTYYFIRNTLKGFMSNTEDMAPPELNEKPGRARPGLY